MYDLKENINEIMVNPVKGKNIGIIRLQMVRESETLYGSSRLTAPKVVVEYARPLFALADREMMVVMSLSNSMEPLALEVAAVGGVSSCQVDIKNIFKHALLNNATNIICFHNHPSGKTDPSKEDKYITERIRTAGDILGVNLVDHIIIGANSFYSMCDQGSFEETQDNYEESEKGDSFNHVREDTNSRNE